MAIIKFENSKDLINYLCKEDVLGILKVSFTSEWSSELTPSFNFYYSDLDEHLSNIFSQWLQETRSAPSEIHLVFTNAEDFSIEAVENFEYNETEKKYAKEIIIYDALGSILDEELELQFENAHIEIEGPDFNLKNLKIKRFEIKENEHKNKEVSLEQVDERIRNLVLTEILETINKYLVKGNHTIECIEHFQMTLDTNYDEFDITILGSPNISGLYDFEDGESFVLDTELLQPEDI
ncbi:hypothetical protein C7S20_05495 [Christiangramia fulva]|uniref:DUF2262 domain-containing protein n=1 Tax=Christiangramia fulva TaxID=2126553 RepID=A0A2R3Z3G5_9FLAO|nr:hypothetical protein [Christiangramia fulva]AVR44762.1 hypothetical protein C7S20_05495 [Christiangramia fulva]